MSAVGKVLDDWEKDAHRIQEGERGARGLHIMASIQQEYLNEATREDEGLIRRWTETLNIILTFAGLLSGTITSFLLAVRPDLEAAPSDATNKILMQILQRLDNTTIPQMDDAGQDSSVNALRVLILWHASLACTLASAFGALMGKQWVLHYQSIPRWANTPDSHCHVREGRYHGLKIWYFDTILELLPVLLQISLLLFAIGLADYNHPKKSLFLSVTIAIGVVGVFFFSTLLAGAFFPSCPFKTPITDLIIDFASAIGTWGYSISYLIPRLLWISIRRSHSAKHTQSEDRKKKHEDLKKELKYYTGPAVGHSVGFRPGSEHQLSKSPVVIARLLCWRLQRQLGLNEPLTDGLEDTAHALMAHPLGASSFYKRYSFWYWCDVVIKRLSREQLHTTSCAVEADLLCHILYHVPESKTAIKQASRHVMGYMAAEQRVMGFLARILRRSWGMGVSRNLPVAFMRPTSITIYLQCQICRWALETPEQRLYRDLLVDELPPVMERDYSHPSSHPTQGDPTINAITVASIAIVERDVPGVFSVLTIFPLEPLEQVFQALHRLSHYSVEHPPQNLQKLLAAAVKASRRILADEDLWSQLADCPSWGDGQLTESLLRLLHLGRLWWHGEQDMQDSEAPGLSLVRAAQELMILLSRDSVGYDGTTSPWAYSSALEEVLAAYAHPSEPCNLPPSGPSPALRLLVHALDTSRQSSGQLLPLPHGELQTLAPPNSHRSAILQRYPQVVGQLIRTIRDTQHYPLTRRFVLSAVVLGRDIFFSSGSPPPELETSLDYLADKLSLSGRYQGLVELNAFCNFNKWGMLVQALSDVEQSLHSNNAGPHGGVGGTGYGGPCVP